MSKYRNLDLKDLAEERNKKIDLYKSIIDKAKFENRKLNVNEENNIKNINREIDLMNIIFEEKRNIQSNNFGNLINIKNNDNDKMNEFSLINEVRNVMHNNPLSENFNEINEKGKREFRNLGLTYFGNIIIPTDFEYRSDAMATIPGFGKELVQTDVYNLQLAVKNRNVLKMAGANFINSLSRNLSLPTYSGSTTSFIYEGGQAANSFSGFSEVTFTPHRISGYIDVSKQFLLQTNSENEQILITDLANSINRTLESVLLSNTSGNTHNTVEFQPAGLFYGKTISISGATSWDNICKMENAIDTNNMTADKMSYIIHPDVNLKAKTTVKTGSQEFIKTGKLLNDYNCFTTSNMPDLSGYKGCIFGNFSDLWITQFGPIDIVVDPYILAGEAKVRITINAYFDWKLRNNNSLVYAKLN